MRRVVPIGILAAAALGAAAMTWQSLPPPPAGTPGAAQPHTRAAPGEWMSARRLVGSEISQARLAKANQDYLRLRATTASRAPALAAASWSFVGPVNIGGRVLDIAVDPLLDDTIFVASASGGVWKSNDAGGTFTSAWPDDNAQPIGALAITSGGLLYAGTGESGPGGGSPTYGNKGVFVSSDHGASWDSSGLEASERISRIAIDPSDEQRLFVAATGPLYAAGGERGVYRSIDGGASWQRVLAGDNETTGASDVFIDPLNPNRIYAVLWDHLRQPALRRYGGPGSGIFRSLDGGDTWFRLGGELPAVSPDVGRIALGMAPSNPDRLYATYLDTIGLFTGFYASTDGGDTWAALPFNSSLSNSQSSFGWWFARLWVDPQVETRVFSAGIQLLRSTNAGAGWNVDSSIHADQHAMAWDPKVAGRLYLGNDGGVYRSDTNGVGGWSFATVQPFTQFYTLDVGEQDPGRLVGGTQDNSCLRSYSLSNPDDWNNWGCGDGLENLINPVDQNLIYGCSQYGSCIRSTNGGESAFNIGPTVSSRRNWLTPLLFDPSDPSIMYYAGDRVNRSINAGASWTAISPDLTGGDPFPSPIDPYPFGTVTTVAVSQSDPDVLYAGTDDARLWRTTNGGTNWTQASDPDLPDRWVTKALVRDDDANVAYIAYSGFRDADDTPYLFKTSDGGEDWVDITGDLPAAPINTLALTALGLLIVGSDIGVFVSVDDGVHWDVLGQGLPQVPITDLRVHEPSAALYASTFGRGIWRVDLGALDSDGDGVDNASDNCTLVANETQIDADLDGFGNACDPDLNNDLAINFQDLGLLKAVFFTPDATADFNGDGAVNFVDLGIMKSFFFGPPGPSAMARANPTGQTK